MSGVDPITGMRYALAGDQASIPFHTKNIVDDARGLMCPTFATATQRDLVITAAAYTPPGIPEGTRCYIIDSGLWEYDGSGWVPVGLRVALSKSYTGSLSASSVAAVTVPGVQGQAFTLNRKRICRIALNNANMNGGAAGDQWLLRAGVDGSILVLMQDNFSTAGSAGRPYESAISAPFVLNPGVHTINCDWSQPSGTAAGLLLSCQLTVTDEGPA